MTMNRMLSLAFALLAANVAVAADEFKPEPGFVRIDNGKNLDGWLGAKDGWTVADGCIHLVAKSAKENIYNEKTHSGDCIIRFEFKASMGADSGFYVHGKQLQVRDYPTVGPKPYAGPAKPAGQWNSIELDFTDNIAVVKLNGEIIEKAWKIGVDPKKGVGIEFDKGEMDYRNIVIKEKKN